MPNSFTDNTTGKYEWGTPQRLFDELDREFHFTRDVCASRENFKVAAYWDKGDDALRQTWTGVCWMNPPYGRGIGMWLKKASESCATVVCLVPSRTDNWWWHRYVMMADEIRFIRGRLRFSGAGDGAKFPSAIVIFKAKGWDRRAARGTRRRPDRSLNTDGIWQAELHQRSERSL